uniref:Uncharacterized protein n=1 Tax=Cacopsylla melanoneura TaxID=428564 RepID=A0A8D9BKE3_9HEMI
MVKRGYGLRCSRPVSGLGPIFKAYLGEKEEKLWKGGKLHVRYKGKTNTPHYFEIFEFYRECSKDATCRCSSQLFKRIRLGRQISRDSRMSSKYYDKSSLLNTLNCQRLNEEHIENLERK